MRMKKIISALLAACLLLPTLALFTGCGGKDEIVLRVCNWEEYIDEGGEGSYGDDYLGLGKNAPSMIERFEEWYEETYNTPIRVEYSTFGTNEDLYNQLQLAKKGDYDLVCPSDYMIMKLAAEGMLETLDENSLTIYNENVSNYIADVFNSTPAVGEEPLSKYAAGYMWGTTGLVYNPEYVSEDDLAQGWEILLDKNFANKVTTKDNVRDTYFVGLAIAYKDELLALDPADAEYNKKLTKILNNTDEEAVRKVQDILLEMKKNVYAFETDLGKKDLVTGKIWINFAWSGDAVYAMDLAEEEDVELNYHVPAEGANLWFDGWVMPKGAKKEPAQAFINFLSMPENAVRNMYYIGYTSVIAGSADDDTVLAYIEETYGADEGEEGVPYDLSYFFGNGAVIYTSEDQLSRQLCAQYPTKEVSARCAVMDYYGEADARINELWTKVKSESLDAWAIIVICVSVVMIAGAILLSKFGGKIDFFRTKPKKGYTLVKQEPCREQ